ncbi:MAG: hypothetical protein H6752_13865 [Candidatus Omnitrophica bacterium]|nr:hypothetical protein [Candidatus Omnitrophota bacterium]
MQRRPKWILWLGILLVVSGTVIWVLRAKALSRSPRRYSIQSLEKEGVYQMNDPRQINNLGDVVGFGKFWKDDNETYYSLVVTNTGEAHLLPMGGSGNVFMNDHREIDGYSGGSPSAASGYRYLFSWPEGCRKERMHWVRGFVQNVPIANNNRGDTLIRGTISHFPKEEAHGFIDTNGNFTFLMPDGIEPSLKDRTYQFEDMNDHRVVVGTAWIPGQINSHAVIWSASAKERLVDPNLSQTSATFKSINDKGICVGDYLTKGGGGLFLWSNDRRVIDQYGGAGVTLNSRKINNRNQVVGIFWNNFNGHFWIDTRKTEQYSRSGEIWLQILGYLPEEWIPQKLLPKKKLDYRCDAFLYEKGRFYDLNDALPRNSHWERLLYASDINDQGQIIGVGVIDGEKRGFLMTPVEEGL